MSHEAGVAVQVHGHTRTQTQLELSTHILIAANTYATIDKRIDEVRLENGVAHIRADLQQLGVDILTVVAIAKFASTLLVAQNHTNSPVAVEVITNLRHKLIGSLSIVVTKFHTTDTYRTAQVNLSIHSHCHSGNEQSHQNLFHVVFPFFF